MKRWDKNWFGAMKGIFIPLFGLGLFYLLNEYLLKRTEINNPYEPGSFVSIDFTEATRALFAICLNIIAIEYYRRKKWFKALNGILMVTLVLAMAWAFYYEKLPV